MRGIVVVCAVIGLAGTACASPADPATLPAASAPTGPTKSLEGVSANAAPTPLEPPSDRSDSTEEGMRFLADYLRVANQALEGPEGLEAWRAIFSDSCEVCLSGYTTAFGIHERGHSIAGGRLVDYSISPQVDSEGVSLIDGDTEAALVAGGIEAAQVKDPEGRVVTGYEAVPSVTVLYTISKQPDGSWLVVAGELVG